MGRWMSSQTALSRVVLDADAPTAARVRALEQIEHPKLAMLRRLLVNSKTRQTPVPSRLRAAAGLAYAKEIELKKRRDAFRMRSEELRPNPLGI